MEKDCFFQWWWNTCFQVQHCRMLQWSSFYRRLLCSYVWSTNLNIMQQVGGRVSRSDAKVLVVIIQKILLINVILLFSILW